MLKNIFLDAGEVILNEENFENYMANIITKVIQNYCKNYSLENYWNDASDAVYRFVPRTYEYILYKNIVNIDKFKKAKQIKKNEEQKILNNDFKLMEEIKGFVEQFSRNYKIGILGQYGLKFWNFLEERNILQYFTFTEIQDDYKITKPDPRYFEAILNKCNCKAKECIMVGDRIDKDIIPAKMIGMKTIRIKTGLHKNQEPRIPEEIPDLTVNKIEDINIETIKAMDYFA